MIFPVDNQYSPEPNCRGEYNIWMFECLQCLNKNTTYFHLLTPHQTKFFTKKSIYPFIRFLPPN